MPPAPFGMQPLGDVSDKALDPVGLSLLGADAVTLGGFYP